MCARAYRTQALPRTPPHASTKKTRRCRVSRSATSRPTFDCSPSHPFFHSASSFLVCASVLPPSILANVMAGVVFYPLCSPSHFASVSPSCFFFPQTSFQKFFTHSTPTAQFPLFSPSSEVPLYFALTPFYTALAKGSSSFPAVYFPSAVLFVMFKRVLPLLSCSNAASSPVRGVTSEYPLRTGWGGGGVFGTLHRGNKDSPRQVNEARRPLCVERHQYSAEAPFAPSSNNIPVIWVSHITLPP